MEKLKNFIEKITDFFLNVKNIVIIYLVLQIILSSICIIFIYNTNDKSWEKVFYYPETEYQEIEKEAKRMAETKDFETKYKCTKNIQDNIANTLTFEIKGENGESVQVIIKNYGNDDEIITIERSTKTARGKVWQCIAEFILVPALCAMLLLMLIFLLVLIIDLIEEILKWRIKKKREKQ